MKERTFRDIFCEHFWITTSGFFLDTALVCSMMEMGIEHAAQHKAQALGRGLDREAPGGTQDAGMRLRVILVIGLDDRRVRHAGWI